MFKNIDKIFCITLRSYTDRKKQFELRFPELVNSEIFEWYITDRDSENTKRGCYNSHKNILDLSKKRGYLQIITFEDDSNLLVPWEQFISVVNGIQYPEYWKIIQLGYFPHTVSKIKNNNTLVKINCSFTTHCYITNVNKLNIPEFSGKEIDGILFCPNYKNFIGSKNVPGMYGIYPNMLVKQNSDYSTITSSRNNQGNLTYNRDTILEMSTYMNYVLFFVILIFVVFILFIIIIIKIST